MGKTGPVLTVAAAALLAVAGAAIGPSAPAAAEREVCQAVGTWFAPRSGEVLTADKAIQTLAAKRIVLLGESHTRVEHHRWQLHTLAGLHALRGQLTVGFEMFPRAVQPALEAWVAGNSDENGFLRAARWQEVWGYDQALYLPLFHFARQNRLPMVALNVNRDLVARVGDDGWAAVPEDLREGLSDPAPATAAYRRSLAEVYAAKQKAQAGADLSSQDFAISDAEVEAALESPGFDRFVEAQSTWDRAMAEGLFTASRTDPDALVVGVLGRGHIEFGHGVPHQLADLGEESVAVLVPIEAGDPCEALDPEVADMAFVVAPPEERPAAAGKPRLGVLIEQADGGVRVLEVVDGSVAAETGLAAGDVIVSAAGFPVGAVTELIEIVQRQAPGTWLPLELTRDGATRQLVAEFPQRFE